MKCKTIINTSIILVISIFCSCSDFIDLAPPDTEAVPQTVFATDGSAMLAVRGIYTQMMSNSSFTWGGLEEFTGIASDELISYSTRVDNLQFFNNSLTSKNSYVLSIFWSQPFVYINNANSIIEGVKASSRMSETMKRQVKGEALFVRAFCYFYLVNLFGDVPFLNTSDYRLNSKTARTPANEVYARIIEDLIQARDLLSDNYDFSEGERIQPNRSAATALLARTYLYLGQWPEAVSMATEIIQNSAFELAEDLDDVFVPNSSETIWQLRPVIPGANTPQGQLFILTGTPNSSSRRVSMTLSLYNSFEIGDKRKDSWTATFTNSTGGWNYIYKYKARFTSEVVEYATVLRLAEIYLVRAEALIHSGDLSGAKLDINTIRHRAGLDDTSADTSDELLAAVSQERRVELCGEYGHRWLDLKRTGLADTILAAIKPEWDETDVWFPIPESERLLNPGLSQNPGY